MLTTRERLGGLLQSDGCVRAASIFDPLSARIAEVQHWPVCKLSGSAAKAASFGLPDAVDVSGPLDMVEICRRILSVVDIPIIVDADDGGRGALNVRRTVRELEYVGVAGIEIEDEPIPTSITGRYRGDHASIVPVEQQLRKLAAALDARRDPTTAIIARTHALDVLPLDEALDRVTAYAKTGVDGVMFPGLPRGLADLEKLRELTDVPVVALSAPRNAQDVDEPFAAVGVKIRYLGTSPYKVAVQAISDAFRELRGEGTANLATRLADDGLVKAVVADGDLREFEKRWGS